MFLFEFIIWIVALAFVFSLVSTWLKQRGVAAQRGDEANRDLAERLARAEDRIRVLERIVTDERYDLKKEIDDLRR